MKITMVDDTITHWSRGPRDAVLTTSGKAHTCPERWGRKVGEALHLLAVTELEGGRARIPAGPV